MQQRMKESQDARFRAKRAREGTERTERRARRQSTYVEIVIR